MRDMAELALVRPASQPARANAGMAPQLAPHLARKLLKTPGQAVRSTLDIQLQRVAQAALARQLSVLAAQHVEDGAVIVLDNASGDVLAWVGSSGIFSDAAQVDNAVARRQAGSTLKPFLYELALERRWLTAASILQDQPLDLTTAAGLYIPQNYDNRFKGLVSLRTALASSLNIPAVRILVMVTPQRFFERLQALGLELRESGDYYGYSLALGSADISLLELTNAYRALANQGRYSPIRTTLTVSDKNLQLAKAVMDSGATFIVTDILADRNARAMTFGLENVLATRVWSAVKTGTSKDMRDNWCIGYSSRYTVGVWMGNSSGEPMWEVSGITGAAPVWQEIIQYLHTSGASVPPQKPADVVMQTIHYQDQLEASRPEYFLSGTGQSVITSVHKTIRPHITSPTSGMLIALDPDIPPAQQTIRFSAEGLPEGRWILDNQPVLANKPADKNIHKDFHKKYS